MQPRQPKVVALVPSYNAGSFLRDAVASLIAQTRKLDQIVVIDDGSTDHSTELLADWEQAGAIQIRRNPENLGKAESLNRTFMAIDADYFILQDADDIALPTRVERQIAFMEANPRLGCSCGFIEYISAKGRSIGRGSLDLLNEERLTEYLAGDEPFGLFCPAAILRSEVVTQPQLQFRGRFWPADDIDLWNRIAEAGWLVLAQAEVIVKYRIHGSSAVSSNFLRTRMQFEWVRACLRARRRGVTEPDSKQFLQQWNSAPWLRRMNRSRKIAAKGFYRSGGFAVAERAYLSAFRQLFAAILLDPSYSVRRLARQVSKSRS
jgi:glycosyltransferase involved in cell wall biosynthesis